MLLRMRFMLGDMVKVKKGKEDFLQVYANLPLDIRKEVILVLDEQPITWNVAYREVSGKTKLSWEILKNLEELKII